MAAAIFDGKAYAQTILNELQPLVASLATPPVLAIVLVGEDPGSLAYIRQKQRFAQQIGAKLTQYHFLSTIATEQLVDAITNIQTGRAGEWQTYLQTPVPIEKPDAIIVQRPLPKQIDYDQILAAIKPTMDIDGFHSQSAFLAPVGMAVVRLIAALTGSTIDQLADSLKNKRVVIVGNGETAGKPILAALHQSGINPTIVNKQTPDPIAMTKTADILITAVGKAHLVTQQWVKSGAIVIDVGISRLLDSETGQTKLAGDCDVSVQTVASRVTPVPGGVGPVNVACLMQNLVAAAQRQPAAVV